MRKKYILYIMSETYKQSMIDAIKKKSPSKEGSVRDRCKKSKDFYLKTTEEFLNSDAPESFSLSKSNTTSSSKLYKIHS